MRRAGRGLKSALSARRLLIAGTGSGCGKTTAVCGILYGLKRMGLRPAAWKCGPDYIDPMFHKRALGIETGNLDLFFSGTETVAALLESGMEHADIGIVEGAMGYYDGIGMTQEASPYALAQASGTPAILVVNARGMGSSLFALIHGFLQYRKPNGIAGVLLNQITGKRYLQLKKPLEEMGIRTVGYLPAQKEFLLESRHLGLVTADEISEFRQKLEKFYELIQNTVDWEVLLQIAESAEPLPAMKKGNGGKLLPAAEKTKNAELFPAAAEYASVQKRGEAFRQHPVTIGVAKDGAFCFLYEDNLRYLKYAGCELVFFSPMRDKELPDGLDGLLLCGGYPELYARALSDNETMRRSIRRAIEGGMPCIAECGGFLYLQKTLADQDGNRYEMAGVLPGHGFWGGRLTRFGYVRLSLKDGNLFGRSDLALKAHEFHYYNCDESEGAFLVEKASGESQWTTGYASSDLYAAFPHIYFYGNEPFAEAFLERAAAYQRKRGCPRSTVETLRNERKG